MPPTATLPGAAGPDSLSGGFDLAFDQFVILTTDLDATRFHRLWHFAHQVDVQQTVFHFGAVDTYIVGQLIGALEIAVCNTAVQVLAIGDIGIFPADDLEQIVLGLDIDFIGAEACDSERYLVLILTGCFDIVGWVTTGVGTVGRLKCMGESIEADCGTKKGGKVICGHDFVLELKQQKVSGVRMNHRFRGPLWHPCHKNGADPGSFKRTMSTLPDGALDQEFFQFHEPQHTGCDQEDDAPGFQVERRGAEQRLHGGDVGEAELENNQQTYGEEHVTVFQQAVPVQYRFENGARVEQIKNLVSNQGIHRHGARIFDAGPALKLPYEQSEGPDHQDHRHEQNAPQKESRQYGFAGVPWRPLHDPAFGWLKCECKGKGGGGDHVDPQDLYRGQREMFESEQDGAQHNQGLTTVGRQDEQDRLAQIVVYRAAFLRRH